MADNLESRISDGTLTLSEWENLPIKKRENYDALKKAISPSKENYLRELEVFELFSPSVKAKQYVGACALDPPIKLADGLLLRQVIITPKIRWADFLRMFEVAEGISLPKEAKERANLLPSDDLRVLFAWLYALEVEELLQKHMRRSFVVRVKRLNARVKGKLLVGPYFRESIARCRPHIAVCQFYELTPDTLVNRIVKAGLAAAKRLVYGAVGLERWPELTAKLNRCLGLMAPVADARITPADFARVRLNALNRYYEYALELARLLIYKNCYEYKVGAVRVRGFFLDMNYLFERFVAGVLTRWGAAVKYQKSYNDRISYRDYPEADAEKRLTVKPDVTCHRTGRTFLVDAKYKEVFDKAVPEKERINAEYNYGGETFNPKHADIYQMNTYLDAARLREGVLVYPSSDPGLVNPYIFKGCADKKIFTVGFGLTNIDKLLETDSEFWDLIKYAVKNPAFPLIPSPPTPPAP